MIRVAHASSSPACAGRMTDNDVIAMTLDHDEVERAVEEVAQAPFGRWVRRALEGARPARRLGTA